MLDSRTLHWFIILAEELHFTRAAQRLHIARSVLSLQIQRLEDILGTALLERNRRAAVRLTRAGETFLGEAKESIRQLSRAEQIGRAAGRLEAGPIEIGYVFSAALNGILGQTLRILGACRPLLNINVRPLETPEQIAAIEQGFLDLGFVRPRPTYPDGIRAQIVHEEDFVLILGSEHRLAKAADVRACDLRNEQFIVPQLAERSGLSRSVDELRALGAASRPSRTSTDFLSAICLAAGGGGVVMAPRSLSHMAIAGTCTREIADFKGTIQLALTYRTDGFDGLVQLIADKLDGQDRKPSLADAATAP